MSDNSHIKATMFTLKIVTFSRGYSKHSSTAARVIQQSASYLLQLWDWHLTMVTPTPLQNDRNAIQWKCKRLCKKLRCQIMPTCFLQMSLVSNYRCHRQTSNDFNINAFFKRYLRNVHQFRQESALDFWVHWDGRLFRYLDQYCWRQPLTNIVSYHQ